MVNFISIRFLWRGLISSAAMGLVLLLTLAAYARSETEGRAFPTTRETKRTSAVAQLSEKNPYREHSLPSIPSGRGDAFGQGAGEIFTEVSTPTPTPWSPTPTPARTLAPPLALSDLEGQMWEAINAERANAGLPRLAIDGRLTVLARERSIDMITRGYFSHTTPEGVMIFDLLSAAGIYSPYTGETLARTNAEASQAVQLAVAGFMNSPAHRQIVLSPRYTDLGVGAATSPEGMKYFTLVFIDSHA